MILMKENWQGLRGKNKTQNMKTNKVATLGNFFNDVDPGDLADFLKEYKGDIRQVDHKQIKKIIRPRPVFGHKGTFGHALIIAGNEGTIGASILCSKAALKTGCGLLTALVPAGAIIPLLVHLPEAMVISRNNFEGLPAVELSKFNAIGFGPGAGTGDESAGLLYYLLNNYKGPLIIDADGFTILSKNREWFHLLKNNTILTPHPAEFDRMTAIHDSEIERLQTQIAFSKEHGVTILLKGHHTSIVTKDGLYFNTTGNNGMATAGSGDVLTGIITSLCAQGYDAGIAAIAGTYLHGYAGDYAAKNRSMHGMIASDIIDGIGEFFKKYEK